MPTTPTLHGNWLATDDVSCRHSSQKGGTAIKVILIFQAQQRRAAVKVGEFKVMLQCTCCLAKVSIDIRPYICFLLRCGTYSAHVLQLLCRESHVCLLLLLHQEHDSYDQIRGLCYHALGAKSILLPHSEFTIELLTKQESVLTKLETCHNEQTAALGFPLHLECSPVYCKYTQ